MLMVRINEVALPPVDKAEEHGAMNRAAIPRTHKSWIRDPQAVDLVVAQAIVFREDDLDGVAAKRARPKTTSPSPPTLATGAHSDAIWMMYG